MKWDLYLIPYKKINSKWIWDLSVRPKIIKLLDRNIRQKLHNIGFGNDFLDMTPKAQAKKENMDKLDFKKIKYLCIRRQYQWSKKATHRMGKNISNHISDVYSIEWSKTQQQKNKQPDSKWAKNLIHISL